MLYLDLWFNNLLISAVYVYKWNFTFNDRDAQIILFFFFFKPIQVQMHYFEYSQLLNTNTRRYFFSKFIKRQAWSLQSHLQFVIFIVVTLPMKFTTKSFFFFVTLIETNIILIMYSVNDIGTKLWVRVGVQACGICPVTWL